MGLSTRGGTASPYGYLTHVAPEVLRTGKTSKASDVYALGVTAYRLLNGDAFLPEESDPSDIQDLILSGDYPNRDYYRPYVPNKVKRIINQCMAIRKSERFSSASEFRKALERICIHCDWRLRRKRRVVTYCAEIGKATYDVIIRPDKKGRFDITTTKQVDSGSERRVAKDCYSDLTLAQMKRQLRRVLPRYVEKGK